MNTPVMITIILLVVLFIAGVIFFQRQKKKNIKLQNLFRKVVKENNLFIHYKDIFFKKLIGFDKKKKKLLLIDMNKKTNLHTCLDIDEIDSCSIVHLKNENGGNPRKVILELIRNGNDKPVRFCFYDEAIDDKHDQACLLVKARHWHQRINFHKDHWWLDAQEYVL